MDFEKKIDSHARSSKEYYIEGGLILEEPEDRFFQRMLVDRF